MALERMRTSKAFTEAFDKSGNFETYRDIIKVDIDSIKHREKINFLHVENSMVCYIDTSKLSKEEINQLVMSDAFFYDKIYLKKRRFIKPGKAVRRILGRDLDTKQIESLLSILNTDGYVIEVVDGEQIRDYYYETTYASRCGSLNQSCMRYDYCQEYFDIYVENAKMAIMKKREPNGELSDDIYGRAILWPEVHVMDYETCEEERIIQVMDRIYSCTTKTKIFTDWAINNGFFHKECQNNCSSTFIGKDEEIYLAGYNSTGIIYLKNQYETYPYMDTFLCTNDQKDSISTSSRGGRYVELQDTEGNTGGEYCDWCDETVNSEMTYVEGYGYVCSHCFEHGDFVYAADLGEYIHSDDSIYCEDCGEYYHNSSSHIEWIEALDCSLCDACRDRAIDSGRIMLTHDHEFILSQDCEDNHYCITHNGKDYVFYYHSNYMIFIKENNIEIDEENNEK